MKKLEDKKNAADDDLMGNNKRNKSASKISRELAKAEQDIREAEIETNKNTLC